MRIILCLLCSFLLVSRTSAQKKDKALEHRVAALIQQHRGVTGVYIKNLNNGKVVSIQADTIFPTASMIKIPILVGIMDKIRRGELAYHQELVYKDSLLYAGVDLLGSFKSGEKVELSKVMMLMLSMSDNTASLWLQSLAGGGTRINTILDSLGFILTRVNSRTPGREEARSQYGWGQTTPKEMATLLERIYRQDLLSPAASERMLRLLGRNFWDGAALSALPPYVALFSKNGAVDASRSEVVLVKGKKSTYVFCLATKNNKDESWAEENEAWVLARRLSTLLWEHFEPEDTWTPAPAAERIN
ncbi:MAG TPA: serine hydrolase [Chitinophagaceae bacterium]|jgi:beta-lactamase class A|nr:serine hydrolase [Chitinophagaceae bacterium]